MNNKRLLIVLAVLVAVYLISKLASGNQKSSFDPQIVMVDSSAVTQIVLTPKAESGGQITLTKENGRWQAEMNGRRVETPYTKVSQLLGQMTNITAKRVVSNTSDKWSDYEVGELGSGVKVLAGSKVLAEFVVGTFKFDQVQRSASSYIRRTDGDEVYLVDGFLSMQFNQGFNAFRNNQLVKLNRQDLRQLSITYPEQTVGIQYLEEDGKWYFAGMEALDSTQMAQYISGLTNAFGSDYIDDFVAAQPLKTLEINGNNLLAPVTVSCYASQDTS
ncbi:MAG: DUF4340 domain-containing protein, partial [Saprospiraceae bacterium]|nr:DUF4340 domain-containing protein [Saprospiraceae bacterium]